jgi:DivIVA domain-containing protein
VAEPRATNTGDEGAAAATGTEGRSDGAGESLARVPADIRNVSFPGAMRGYDRDAVDVYVRRVNRVIAELEVTRSPQAAVRHAVERVSEQTKAVLEEARESAEQINATAREEGEGIIGAAKAEAAELVVNAGEEARRVEAEAEQLMARTRADAEQILARANADAEERKRQTDEELAARQEEAEARMRELAADTDVVREERKSLLDDIEQMATQLHDAAAAAAARFSHGAASDSWETDPDQTVVIEPDEAAETSVAEGPDPGKRPSAGRKKN